MTDQELMRIALDEARGALSRSEFPVGCVIASPQRVLVRSARHGSAGVNPSELDHAEIIALRRLEALPAVPVRRELTLAVTLEPCLMCYGAILLAGIGRIVYAYEDVMGGGTACALESVGPLYGPRRPRIVAGIHRREALKLFQSFFADPALCYWQGSLLARHTLAGDGGG
jgi:tRNA(adenine34) deaminase